MNTNFPLAGVQIGVRELRSELADVVRRANAGERTIITNHGRAVAQVAPLDDSAPDLERLLAAGLLIAPRRTDRWRAPQSVELFAGVRIDRALRELRG